MSGGGKGAKSAKAPDYTALAKVQGDINQKTAQQLTQANRPNQYDAFGNSITWNQTGPNQWDQVQTLSPEIKDAWGEYITNAKNASSSYGRKLNDYLSAYTPPEEMANFSSDAQNLKGYNDAEFNGDNVANALYGSVMDRGRVEQQRESDSLTSQLRNSGLQPGSEAYDRAMKNLMTSQNDANLLAAQNATLAGGAEGRAKYGSYLAGEGQQYGQDLSSYGANASTYQLNRNQPLQELSGMAGVAGGQPYSPTYQGFSGATGYNPTDLVGAAQAQYGAKQNSANASNSKKSGLMGAGASLGGSYLGSK